MLAPNATQVQDALQGSLTAAGIMTVYAGAIRFAVAPLLSGTLPGWFDPIKASIDTAVTNAADWMDDLCIDVTTTVPQALITFVTVFDKAADDLSNLQTEITMVSGVATAAQKKQAVETLGRVQAGVRVAQGDVGAIENRLGTLIRLVQADHDALAGDSGTIAMNVPDGGTTSKTISADLGNDFLNFTPNGPCMVSIDIKSDIMVQITQTAGSHAELLPYVIAQRLIDKAIADNAKATGAISQMMAVWSLMSGLVGSAIDDLQQASDSDVLPILQKAEFEAARQVWDQLSLVATSILQNG